MTFDSSLYDLMNDTVTVEPCTAEGAGRALTFGTAVTYRALVQLGRRRVIGRDGREQISNTQVMIPNRVAIDIRSRITLPTGFVPNQPPIMGIEYAPVGIGLDHTMLLL